MSSFNQKAADFLAQEHIAVVGVSRDEKAAPNLIYQTLKKKGIQVYAVNPNMEAFGEDPSYPSVKEIPARLDGVFIMTKPETSKQVVAECIEVDVPRVWMHENALAGEAHTSVSQEAVEMCKANNIEVIAGGCPMMFLEFGHKCMRWIFGMMGKLPE